MTEQGPNLGIFLKSLQKLIAKINPKRMNILLIRLSKYWNQGMADEMLLKLEKEEWIKPYKKNIIVLMDDERTTCALSILNNGDIYGGWTSLIQSN